MVHTIFQGLLSLYKFLYIMVILQWDVLLVDFYYTGALYDEKVSDKKILGFIFGWMIFVFISIHYLTEVEFITEVFLPRFFLDMIIIIGMALTYGWLNVTRKLLIFKPRIVILKLFCYISLFTMIFSYLK